MSLLYALPTILPCCHSSPTEWRPVLFGTDQGELSDFVDIDVIQVLADNDRFVDYLPILF